MISDLCSVAAPEAGRMHAVSAISFFQFLQLNDLCILGIYCYRPLRSATLNFADALRRLADNSSSAALITPRNGISNRA